MILKLFELVFGQYAKIALVSVIVAALGGFLLWASHSLSALRNGYIQQGIDKCKAETQLAHNKALEEHIRSLQDKIRQMQDTQAKDAEVIEALRGRAEMAETALAGTITEAENFVVPPAMVKQLNTPLIHLPTLPGHGSN